MEVDETSSSPLPSPPPPTSISTDIPVQCVYSENRSCLFAAFHLSSALHFIGCIRIRVLYGSLKIHGCILNPDGKYHRIFSTSSHPTYITHSTTCPYMDIGSLEEFLFLARTNTRYGVSAEDSEKILYRISEIDEENFVSLCIIKSTTIPIAFFTRKKFKNLFQLSNTIPTLPFFYPLKSPKSLLTPKIAARWENIIESGISQISSPKILVCGPKGTGKSSFSIYLANYLLNTHQVVFFIECDPGQPEFLPTGTLGIQALSKPKLGPAYTHKVSSEINYFYGSTSPGSNPELYIEIIKKMLVDIRLVYDEDSDIPVIINTCGWVDGLGLNLLSDIIYLTKPSVIIVQCAGNFHWLDNMDSEKINQNRVFTQAIDSLPYHVELVKCNVNSSLPEIQPSQDTCLLYAMESFLSSIIPTVKSPEFTPLDLRALSLMTYFSNDLKLNSPFHYLEDILFQCPLYEIPIHRFLYQKISAEFPSSRLIDVLNANIIGLGKASSDDFIEEVRILGENVKFLRLADICSCLGLGFVRFINEKEKKLFVTTPVKFDKLEQVNVIMIGSHTLCQSFYLYRKLDENTFYSLRKGKTKSKAYKCRKANKQLKNRTYLKRLNYNKHF